LGLPSLFRSLTGTVQGAASPVVKSVLALNVITGCALAAATKQIIKSKDKFFRTPSEKNQNEILPYSHKLNLGGSTIFWKEFKSNVSQYDSLKV